MNLSTAFVLGAVQGLTEFLPISSSGHLVIGQHLLGMKEPAVFFDVCLHIGTLGAVLLVFYKDLGDLAIGAMRLVLKRPSGTDKTLGTQERAFLLVLVGTLPTVFLGLFARHFLESAFASVPAVSFNLLITGGFLWLTRYFSPLQAKPIPATRWQHALYIGFAQGLALAPGISRSGATISTGLLLGLEREWAGRFSFLLFVPAVFGALILESFHIEINEVQIIPTLMGVITAGAAGYVALRILLRIVRRGNFYLFAPYCWLVGGVCLVWSLMSRS